MEVESPKESQPEVLQLGLSLGITVSHSNPISFLRLIQRVQQLVLLGRVLFLPKAIGFKQEQC